MDWLNKLKIAVVQKDTKLVDKLLDDIPALEDEKEIKNALFLLDEAVNIVQNLQNETAISMKQLKKNIDFLSATQSSVINKLDITS